MNTGIPYAPTGQRIVGTLERVKGVALIETEVIQHPNGGLTYVYQGETQIDWDSQQTVEKNGGPVFVDEAGGHWNAAQITLRTEARHAA